jgi:hypothetical protein
MGLGPTQGDEKRLGPVNTLYGNVAPSFVIPSEAEGSAVPRTFRGNTDFAFRMNCQLDRSVPGFPTKENSQRPRMRLSVKKGA